MQQADGETPINVSGFEEGYRSLINIKCRMVVTGFLIA